MLAPDGKERKALRRRLLLLLLLLPPVLRHDRKRDPTSSLCFLKALLLSEQPTDRPTTKNPRKRRGSENMQLPRRGIRRRRPQICHCGIANDQPVLPICPMEDIRVIEWRIFEFRTEAGFFFFPGLASSLAGAQKITFRNRSSSSAAFSWFLAFSFPHLLPFSSELQTWKITSDHFFPR